MPRGSEGLDGGQKASDELWQDWVALGFGPTGSRTMPFLVLDGVALPTDSVAATLVLDPIQGTGLSKRLPLPNYISLSHLTEKACCGYHLPRTYIWWVPGGGPFLLCIHPISPLCKVRLNPSLLSFWKPFKNWLWPGPFKPGALFDLSPTLEVRSSLFFCFP